MITSVTLKDHKTIEKIVKESFEKSIYHYQGENEIIQKVRELPNSSYIEKVAVKDHKIVGYGLLSPAFIQKETGLVLAPLAVQPDFQHQGIGKALIADLEKVAQEKGYPFIHILGDPDYYQPLGYEKAENYQITAPFPVESKYFLIKILQPEKISSLKGDLLYNKAFL